MTTELDQYLNSDELRLLTKKAASYMQIEQLLKFGIPFSMDQHFCPIVKYQDAKQYLLLLATP